MVKVQSGNFGASPNCSPARALLSRLRTDLAGNVLGIAAATLPPLLMLVGGGIDMGRAYLTQTSLQAACDAGVLAGRRAQAKSGQWGSAEITKANRMFNYNFLNSGTNASNTTFTPTDAGSGVISASASTTMPTTVMKMFGKDDFTLSTTCSAEFQISNIDVMFVLDTTGSMACEPSGYNCGSGSTSKIYGLKEAVRQFYYTMAQAIPAGGTARLRFGFVPYAGTVNLGDLVTNGDIPTSYFTSTTQYSTKNYNYDTANYPFVIASSVQGSGSACTTWANAPATASTTYSYVSYSGSTCKRKETSTTQSGWKLNPSTPYTYKLGGLDTSVLKTRSAVDIVTSVTVETSTANGSTVPTAGQYDPIALAALSGTTGITKTSTTWGGCIEERNTVASLFTNNSAPSGAYDHDLTSAPTSDATRWHPYIGRLVYDRNQNATLNTTTNYGSTGEYCVPKAVKFTTIDTSSANTVPGWLETYLGTLVANGNTYHDIGMVWGARLANPNGIMATNVNEGNLSSISRHIIMLTDGEMAPNSNVYNAYGMESIDNRVAPYGTSDSSLINYHNARFLTACATAKAMGYTIWFIGFGQTLSAQMQACASSGRAYFAGDSAALSDTFRHIASQVADLRLKQ